MRAYIFVVRDNDAEAEMLGAMALPNDAEALDFGRRVSQDLNDSDYAGRNIDIFEGARAVTSITVE
jgi:hypothetical protein